LWKAPRSRAGRVGGGQVLALHRLDPLAQQGVEPRIVGAVPHLPEEVRRLRRLRDIIALQSRQRFGLGLYAPAALRSTREDPYRTEGVTVTGRATGPY